jgi:hypothetical protein
MSDSAVILKTLLETYRVRKADVVGLERLVDQTAGEEAAPPLGGVSSKSKESSTKNVVRWHATVLFAPSDTTRTRRLNVLEKVILAK